MAPINNGSAIFNEIPQGLPVIDKTVIFKNETIDLEAAQLNGGILVKALYLSIDPYLQSFMRDPSINSFVSPFNLGKSIWGFGVASVMRSEKDGIREGDILYVPELLFQQYSVVPADGLVRIIQKEENVPLSSYIGLLGMPGMTGFYGMELVGKPRKGEIIYVSSGASAVGSLVAQLAKIKGLKVIASAGSDEKITFMKSIGVDVAFNYKTDSIAEVLAKEGPIDLFWDNVGGSTLEAAIDACKPRARLVLCGAISAYNAKTPYGVRNTPSILFKQLLVQGFFVTSGEPEYEGQLNNPVKFLDALVPLVRSGKLKQAEQVFYGIESVGEAIVVNQNGFNTAKVVVKVAEP